MAASTRGGSHRVRLRLHRDARRSRRGRATRSPKARLRLGRLITEATSDRSRRGTRRRTAAAGRSGTPRLSEAGSDCQPNGVSVVYDGSRTRGLRGRYSGRGARNPEEGHENGHHRRRGVRRLAPVRTVPAPRAHEVICVDNLLTGIAEHRPPAATTPASRSSSTTSRSRSTSTGRVDNVLHFATPASPVDYLRAPDPDAQGRLAGHAQRARAGQGQGQASFLLASTSEVYGDPEVHPQREDYWGHVNPIGPRGCYDEAKRFAEAITMAYHRYHGVQDPDRPDLQHLRPAHAAQRRPRAAPPSWARSSAARP